MTSTTTANDMHLWPHTLLTILDTEGLDDALRACIAVCGHDRDLRLFAVWCARRLQCLIADNRSINALDVAERYARGRATDNELAAARAAARAAAQDNELHHIRDAAVYVPGVAARSALWTTSRTAGVAAVRAAAWASKVAQRGDARSAARDAQEVRFRKMLENGTFIGSTHHDELADTARAVTRLGAAHPETSMEQEPAR